MPIDTHYTETKVKFKFWSKDKTKRTKSKSLSKQIAVLKSLKLQSLTNTLVTHLYIPCFEENIFMAIVSSILATLGEQYRTRSWSAFTLLAWLTLILVAVLHSPLASSLDPGLIPGLGITWADMCVRSLLWFANYSQMSYLPKD